MLNGKGDRSKMIIEIDNPCYHCYTGAVGYCREIGCKYEHYSWSEDLETDYKVEYDDEDDKEIKEND